MTGPKPLVSGLPSGRVIAVVIVTFTLCTTLFFMYFPGLTRTSSSPSSSPRVSPAHRRGPAASVQSSGKKHVTGEESAVSGAAFKGQKVREWPGLASATGFGKTGPLTSDSVRVGTSLKRPCQIPLVAVTTTISNDLDIIKKFRASSALRQVPVVVAGDLKGPTVVDLEAFLGFPLTKFDPEAIRLHPPSNGEVYLLTVPDQNRLFPAISKQTPTRSFARKNLGYLAAVAMGACTVWDFDDDNYPTNFTFYTPEALRASQRLPPLTVCSHRSIGVNPYVLMGATLDKSKRMSSSPIWPRGLPLTDKTKEEIPTLYATHQLSSGAAILSGQDGGKAQRPSFAVGVVQSLADHDPDVDAIYRLTSSLPVTFRTGFDLINIHPAQFAPFNGQATMWHSAALWASYLPVTVNGRVSDIWRSYVAQALMRCAGLTLAFSAPAVIQMRNAHDYQGDLNAEQGLYQRTEALVSSLTTFHCRSTNLGDCLFELYVDLYERNFIQTKDVENVRVWVDTLRACGYRFPAMRRDLCSFGDSAALGGPEAMFRVRKPASPSDAFRAAQRRFSVTADKSIVVVNVPRGRVNAIPVWKAVWQHVSPRAYFYSPGAAPCRSMATRDIHCISSDAAGRFGYESAVHAMEHYANSSAYVVTRDDVAWDPRLALRSRGSVAYSAFDRGGNFPIVDGGPSPRSQPSAWAFSDASAESVLQKIKTSRVRGANSVTTGLSDPVLLSLSRFCFPRKVNLSAPASAPSPYDTYSVLGKDRKRFLEAASSLRQLDTPQWLAVPWILRCSIIGNSELGTLAVPARGDYSEAVKGYCGSTRYAEPTVVRPVNLVGNPNELMVALSLRQCFLDAYAV